MLDISSSAVTYSDESIDDSLLRLPFSVSDEESVSERDDAENAEDEI